MRNNNGQQRKEAERVSQLCWRTGWSPTCSLSQQFQKIPPKRWAKSSIFLGENRSSSRKIESGSRHPSHHRHHHHRQSIQNITKKCQQNFRGKNVFVFDFLAPLQPWTRPFGRHFGLQAALRGSPDLPQQNPAAAGPHWRRMGRGRAGPPKVQVGAYGVSGGGDGSAGGSGVRRPPGTTPRRGGGGGGVMPPPTASLEANGHRLFNCRPGGALSSIGRTAHQNASSKMSGCRKAHNMYSAHTTYTTHNLCNST